MDEGDSAVVVDEDCGFLWDTGFFIACNFVVGDFSEVNKAECETLLYY